MITTKHSNIFKLAYANIICEFVKEDKRKSVWLCSKKTPCTTFYYISWANYIFDYLVSC